MDMTVVQTQTFKGEDEQIVLPVTDDVRRTQVKLPNVTTSKSRLVLVDKMTSVKRPEPAPNQRILCTSQHYIASLVSTRTGPIIKLYDKEDIGKCTKIKDITGRVVNIMFRNVPTSAGTSDSEGRPDELFAVISVTEETGELWLAVYEILLNDKGDLDNSEVIKLMLCNDILSYEEDARPVLAIQPSTPTTFIAVAVRQTVYFVTIEDGCYKNVTNFTLQVEHPIATLHIAVDESATLCACSRDGTLVFYNPMEREMADPDGPFKLPSVDENDCVNWIGFPDDSSDCEDPENSRVWTNLIAATDTSIIILSLTHWTVTYRLDLILPEDQDLSERLLYSLDDRGRFLVISSKNSNYLYVLELTTTQGHQAPDAFSRMFCFPMTSGLFDLSISHVVEEENVQGRYQNNTVNSTLCLIAVNSNAMLKCEVKLETEGQITRNNANVLASPSPRQPVEAPHQPDLSTMAPAVQSLLASSAATSSSSRPQHQHPNLLSPNAFTATPIPLSKLLPSIPTSAPAAPSLSSLSHDLPKRVPRSSSYESHPLVGLDDDLVPTPLTTPAGRETSISEVGVTVSPELQDLIQRVMIQGSEDQMVEEFDAVLYGDPLIGGATDNPDYLERFSRFYYQLVDCWSDIHPTVLNQVLVKHLLMATIHPGTIGAICSRVPGLGEDIIPVLTSLVGNMFSAPSWRIALSQFDAVRKVIYELYRNSIPDSQTTQNMMLVLFEKIVKSHFDVLDEEDPALEEDWNDFIRINIGTLRDHVKEMDSTNNDFIIKVLNVIEPLKELLPKEYGSLNNTGVSGGQNKLRMLMETSRASAGPTSEGEGELDNRTSTYQPDYNTRLVALLSYLDDTETVSLQEVYRLVAMVTAAPDQEGLADLAEAIVNNYYSKDWFKEVINGLWENVFGIKAVLMDSLNLKLSEFLSRNENNHRSVKKMSVKLGLYKHCGGTSPTEFYIRELGEEPHVSLINTTLTSLFGDLDPDTDTRCPLNVGSLVACYRGYRDWRRGEVVSLYGEDDLRVRLVDSGEVVSTGRECLRDLPAFRNIPGKALLVRLHGGDCPEEHTDRVMTDFKNILRGEELRVLPEKTEDGVSHIRVRLSDNKNLAEVLSDRGHVIWADDGAERSDSYSNCQRLDPFSPDAVFTEELQRMMKDDAQPRHLDLVDMVKFVHKYSSRPEEWAPEIRDVLILKAREVLETESATDSPQQAEHTSPSTSNSIAAISSPDSASPPPTSPTRQSPLPTDPVVTSSSASQDPVILSEEHTVPPEPEQPMSDQHSRPQSTASSVNSELLPTFRSLDIRESEPQRETNRPSSRGGFPTELRDLIERLTKSVRDTKRSKGDLNRKVNQLLENSRRKGPRGSDLQQDLTECANLMYDRAFDIFEQKIRTFYHEEVTHKLKIHQDEMIEKQNQIQFTVTKKMDESIQNDVTKIVKEVNDEVKKSAEERLASDETLKTLVREKLVPSFQKQLDYVYQSFHGTLNTELQHYSQFTEQASRAGESEILAQLHHIEGMLDRIERAQETANLNLCARIETKLSRSVEELYMRHNLEPPARRPDMRRHTHSNTR
ncbi:hypothetical protein ACHWQZ_G009998 [Mnemiopsis leidyi]